MANAWDVLLQQAQPGSQIPVDPGRSADFDSLYGLNEQPGDSDAVKFSKGLQSSLLRNSPAGRETQQEMIKTKLATQMQMQLAQAQKQLEQQYPTYQMHATPWGGIVSFNPTTGQASETYSGDPAAKGAFQAHYAAQTNEDNYKATPEYIQQQRDAATQELSLKKAQTGEANAMAALRPEQAAAYNRRGIPEPKPWTTEDSARVREAVYEDSNYGKSSLARQIDISGKKAEALKGKVDAAIAEAKAQREQEIAQARGSASSGQLSPRSSGGIASPATPMNAPDSTDLLNPIDQ